LELKLYIAGTEYNLTNKYTMREQVGQTSSSNFDIRLEGKEIPKTHSKVEFKKDGTTIFAGFISAVDTPTYSTTYETQIVPLQVLDLETIFNRRIVSEAYTDKWTHEIVNSLFDNYLAEENLVKGKKLIIPSMRMSDVLQELADENGAVARISPAGVFSFTTKSGFNHVAVPELITGIKLSEAGSDLKTIQRVSGAKAETSSQSLALAWATDQINILLGYQLASEPSATINSISVDIGLIGADEENPSKTFLWKYGNNAIVLNENATVKPTAGDTVAVSFIGFYNIEIVQENEGLKQEIADISGTSGKIESILVDTSITDPQDGENKAQDLLSEKSTREQTLTLTCHDADNSALLSVWTLNYPSLGIQGDFVIVERTITDFYDKFKINVKLKNRGFYSRYGTILNKNDKQINNLSVRTDDVIFKQSSTEETVTWTEEIESDMLYMQFSCGTTDILSPCFFEGSTLSGGIL